MLIVLGALACWAKVALPAGRYVVMPGCSCFLLLHGNVTGNVLVILQVGQSALAELLPTLCK